MTSSTGHRLRAAALALSLALAGTALAAANKSEATDKPGAKGAGKSIRELTLPARTEPLSSGQAIYQILLGEFALQRNRLDLSAAVYSDLAQRSNDLQAVARSVEIAGFARQYGLALENAKLWVDLEPNSATAKETLVGLLVLLDHLDEAMPLLEKLLAESKSDRAEDFARINRLFARHANKKEVKTLVDRLSEPYLTLPEAYYARAQAAFAADNHDEALQAIHQALRLRPDWDAGILFEAQVHARDNHAEQGIALLQDYLGRHPDARNVRLHLSRLLVGEKRYSDARHQLNWLTTAHPDDPEVLYPAAILSLQQNDLVSAERELRHLLDLDFADRNIVRYYLGQIADDSGRIDEARDWYEQVTPGEHYLNARGRLATQLARAGKLDDARALLRNSHSSSAQERTQLTLAEARLLRQAQRNQEALDLLNNALDKQPNQPDLLYDSAIIAERLGQMDAFDSRMRKLMKLQPDNPQSFNALGYSYAERNIKLDEARKLIEEALKRAPDDPYILDSLGWVLYRQKNHAAALDILERAYAVQADAEIAAHLGEVLWQMGRHDDARRTWQEASKLSPNNEVLGDVIRKFTP